MAPLVVPGAVLVRLIWTQSGTPVAVNVLGGRKTTATTIDQDYANTLGGGVKAALTSSALVAGLGNVVALANVGVRDISSPNLPEFLDTGAAVPGTVAADLLPPSVALCATLRTAKAGKSFRGRYYQYGFTETHNLALGTADAAVSTALDNFLTILKDTTFTSSGLNLAVISRKTVQATDVTVVLVRDLVWDSQRRRASPGI